MVRYQLLISILLLGLGGCGRAEPDRAETNEVNGGSTASSDESSTATAAAVPEASSASSSSSASKADSSATAGGETAPVDIRTLAVRLLEPDTAGGWRISEQAALQLEKRGPNAVDELWPLLEDKSAETRRGAAYYLLGHFNPNSPEQVDAFLRRLQDEDTLVRGIALQAVQQMRPADLITSQAILTEVLDPAREPNPDQRITVIRVLQRLKAKAEESADSLKKAANSDPDPQVRAAALVALSQIAPAVDVVAAAQEALTDEDAGVRLVAAARLRQLGKESLPASEALGRSLEDTDERVRSAAAEALVRIGADAVPALTQQLDARPATARQLAVACLSRIGPPAKEALPELEKRLQDEDETVRKLAAVAIGKIKLGQPSPAGEE